MNHDAKKNVCPFMRMRSVCIALIAAVTFFGCKQNMGNESKTPAVQKFALTFSVDGGNGSLEAKVDGTKINSGDQVEKGKTVEFTAVPANAATHEVDAWTVSKGAFEQGTGGKGSTTASLKVTDAAAVTVKFKQKDIPPTVQYKVTLEKTVGGNVTVTPALPESGMVNKNTELTFTATKLGGYKFVKWERDGADTGVNEPTYKLTVTQPVRIKAVFEVDGTPITKHTVTLTPSINGTVTSVPEIPSDKQVADGTEITFTATAASGYAVEKWTVSPNTALKTGGAAGSKTATITITADTTVAVTFKHSEAPSQPKHTLTFSVDGGNGSLEAKVDGTKINSGNQVEKGKTVEFTAKPFSDYSVDTWSIDGSAFEEGSGAAGSQTARIKITAGTTVKVKFKPTLTDQEKLEKAKEALQLSFQNTDTANNISSTWLSLPTKGLHNTKISWKSSDEAIIKIEQENEWNCYGRITRPEENTQVTLTATITKGDASTTKSFTVTVRGTNEDAVISAAEQAVRAIPSFVTKDTSPIQLKTEEKVSIRKSDNSSVEVEVTINWDANPAGVISVSDRTVQGGTVPAGTVTPHETEIKKVRLTATAKKGNAESSKAIEVTVYPKNNDPNLQTVVESIVNEIPTEIDADIQLPKSPSGYKLTWSSSNDSILKIAGNSGHIETWDLVNRTVKLTATLKKNATGEQATKPKTLTIKDRKKFTRKANIYGNGGTYEFDGNKLTLRHGDDEPTAVYRVENIDSTTKTITATLERITYSGRGPYTTNTLLKPEEMAKSHLASIEQLFDMYFSLFEFQQKPLVTLQDIRITIQQFPDQPNFKTDKELFEKWFQHSLSMMSYEEFSKKTEEEQSELLKTVLKSWHDSIYKTFGFDKTVPLTEARAKQKLFLKKAVEAHLERAKKAYVYQYHIEGEVLHTNAQYIPNTLWYRQPGKYSFHAEDGEIKDVSLLVNTEFDGTTYSHINIKKANEQTMQFFAGNYDGSSAFKAKKSGHGIPDEEIDVTITGEDKDSHTLSVTISGAVSFTDVLTFSGKPIPESWDEF